METIIFIILAAICNAVMDIISFHYQDSRFFKLSYQYWFPEYSWTNKYIDHDHKKGLRFKFPFAWVSNFLDAWHLFKMLMIIFIFLAIISYEHNFHWVIEGAIFYVAWNGTFELFYSKIFKR